MTMLKQAAVIWEQLEPIRHNIDGIFLYHHAWLRTTNAVEELPH